MSESVQGWILQKKGFVNYVNNNLAKRSGVIGRVFTLLSVGNRQMGQHRVGAFLKFVNHYLVKTYTIAGTMRPILSRFVGHSHGTLNFTGIAMWAIMSGVILSRVRFTNARDVITFDAHDSPDFYYKSFGMLFPPNYMNNKVSAHYIEINQIYAFEMFKRYRKVRQDVFEERNECSDKEKRTRYITNPNYVYEPLGKDSLSKNFASLNRE